MNPIAKLIYVLISILGLAFSIIVWVKVISLIKSLCSKTRKGSGKSRSHSNYRIRKSRSEPLIGDLIKISGKSIIRNVRGKSLKDPDTGETVKLNAGEYTIVAKALCLINEEESLLLGFEDDEKHLFFVRYNSDKMEVVEPTEPDEEEDEEEADDE